MELNVVLQRQAEEVHAVPCVVDKIIELSEMDYADLYQNLLEPHSFLKKYQGMTETEDDVRHCLLVLGEGQEDGILIDNCGTDYVMYSAFIPQARQLAILEQHPYLAVFNERMAKEAEAYAKKAITDQQDGIYRILLEDLKQELAPELTESKILLDMLEERPEIAFVDDLTDEVAVKLAPEYVREEKELPRLTQEQADVICARHVLWLHDAGGEQADFSGYDLSELDLSHRDLNSAVFAGARMYRTNLLESELCFADFSGADMLSCTLKDVSAEETGFKKAVLDGCDLRGAILTHSNFAGAVLQSCQTERSNWTNCCVAGAIFQDTSMEQTRQRNISDDEQDWLQAADPAPSM